MSYLSKTSVSIGANPQHKFPMHPMHLTTSKFMFFDIAFAKEFPKHHVKFNHQTFIRTMPLKRPLMSAVNFHKSAYFVPFRTVWEPYTDFKEDTPHVQQEGAAILSNVPLLSNNTLLKVLTSNDFASIVSHDDPGKHDFVTDATGVEVRYRFKSRGRDAFKLLRSLGYGVYFLGVNPNSDRTQSALPLLCAAKVYLDYFFPNQYAHSGYYINLDGIFNRQYIYTLSEQDLLSIFEVCRFVAYSDDYFVSAFDSPLGPSSGVSSVDYNLVDISEFNLGDDYDPSISGNLSIENADYNGVPSVKQNTASQRHTLTQYMDSALKALNNYIRRHGLASSRSLERYLADWGVALSADKLKRCYKLGEKHYPLQVADIVSSADTLQEVGQEVVGAALGDYAGKGVAFNGDFNFESESDEFGYLIIVNTIVPEVSYYQGVDRNVLHKTRLDFLTGDFDGLGTRPITSDELFVGMSRASVDYDSIFGFTPIYSEYKTAVDKVSGDFLLDTINGGLEGWSTLREFEDTYSGTLEPFDVVHSFNFVLGYDWEQYNRIFLDSEDDSDKFVVVHRANLEASLPAVPLYDFFDFEDFKQKIKLDVNGVKSN